jgi:hypothetical protein
LPGVLHCRQFVGQSSQQSVARQCSGLRGRPAAALDPKRTSTAPQLLVLKAPSSPFPRDGPRRYDVVRITH